MRAVEIIKILGEMGGRFPRGQVDKIINYFSKMMADGRVIFITEDREPHAILTFSLGNDYKKFYKKGTWDYVDHDPSSRVLYLELLVCRKWTKELRKQFEEKILKLYPQIEEAHWHRWASFGDREVQWRRRVYV